MVFPGLGDRWLRYPRWRATARPPRLPCQLPSMLRHVFRKAEDAGRLAPVKDDNAAKGGPERPAGMCALVS